ncbi:hypothetical protein NEIMUCOT_03900 [Neisseria mucosa ATCC 25996]|uniref:Uncharacterized protein n=1 Tax=Neisseria mucosa (strain ATCC 25996 / DSM 4631 / NCTC 10774 / M26) TaxID=546266 RepID=D2ZTG5_NEIM2|nr:hypothetical protein NEIMUCOT_03900 [Neisseria mucosa ATCC 25996]
MVKPPYGKGCHCTIFKQGFQWDLLWKQVKQRAQSCALRVCLRFQTTFSPSCGRFRLTRS